MKYILFILIIIHQLELISGKQVEVNEIITRMKTIIKDKLDISEDQKSEH